MRKGFFFILAFVIVSVPLLASADLVPCGGPNNPCRACDLVELAQRVLKWLIGTMTLVIALTFALGGFKMVMAGGDTGQVSGARDMMKNSVVGFLILLSGWLIVNTLLTQLIDPGKFNLKIWNQIQCVDVQAVAVTPATPTTPECSDDSALMRKYNGSVVGVEDPRLRTMINCYLADREVAAAVDNSQIYTVDRTNPRCSLTNGNTICGPCSHSVNSCHYGRGSGTGAKAVDFNAKVGFTEAYLYSKLQARQSYCGGTLITEGDHSHISMSGC